GDVAFPNRHSSAVDATVHGCPEAEHAGHEGCGTDDLQRAVDLITSRVDERDRNIISTCVLKCWRDVERGSRDAAVDDRVALSTVVLSTEGDNHPRTHEERGVGGNRTPRNAV